MTSKRGDVVGYYGTAVAETIAQNASTDSHIGGWGGDASPSPITAAYTWFVRGGEADSTAVAGVFSFNRNSGAPYSYFGWRAVVCCE